MKLDRRSTLLLCRIAHAVAAADRAALEAALDACLVPPAMPSVAVEEAILQGIPYSGFPGAGEALGLWRERAPAPPGNPEATLLGSGEEIFEQVYGKLTSRVRRELARRHTSLEEWIVDFAYGQVMGRGTFDLATLEALGVASLLAQRRRSPLHSHLRGAIRAGWTPISLRTLINGLGDVAAPEILEFARETIEALRRSEAE